ncbi:SH3 domain-containing protein [Pseudonocardia xishanensis]
MKASLQRPGRIAAAVGGAVAVGAAGLMAVLAGTASAATPGVCTDNVNVRAEPAANAKIVAVCDRGTKVEIGQERNGFVELVNLGGWSVKDYVKADAAAPADPNKPADAGLTAPEPAPATTPAPGAKPAPGAVPAPGAEPATGTAPAAGTAADPAEAPANAPAEAPAEAKPSGLGGLLGR